LSACLHFTARSKAQTITRLKKEAYSYAYVYYMPVAAILIIVMIEVTERQRQTPMMLVSIVYTLYGWLTSLY
jgi:hypothetical protein